MQAFPHDTVWVWEAGVDWTEGYVDVGYTHDFYRELNPAMHRFALLSRSIQTGVDPERFSYCELGCGHGFSTLLLAAAHPDAEFHANDFLPSHIAYARKLAADTGVANASFYDDSFEEFGRRDLPDFDIIVLHGVYSWVSAENRKHIVDFIARRLKIGGVVYISYNCHPGWAAMSPLRDLMIMFAGNPDEPILNRIDHALDKVQGLFDANSLYTRVYPMLKDRFDSVRKQTRSYVAHEYFNRDWTIFYHTDVARDFRDAKLNFGASVQMLDHLDHFNLNPEQQKLLNETPNADHREVLRDFLANRQFRRDLYVKGGLSLAPLERNDLIANTRFALSVLPAEIPRNLLTALGSFGLNPAAFDPVIAAFERGPRTIRQLQTEDGTKTLGFALLLDTVMTLVGNNHLQPCLDAAGDARRSSYTKTFNTAIMQHAKSSGELAFLASPLTGGGVYLDRFGRLFLLGYQSGHADPAAFARDCLIARGERLIRDGKLLESPEDNLTYLREQYERFKERLPLLKQLGIV